MVRPQVRVGLMVEVKEPEPDIMDILTLSQKWLKEP
jgi:hypothetical protein